MLVAFAGHEFRLSRRMKDGSTERDHLLAAQRMLGRALLELESPPLPDWMLYLWGWFVELHQGRQAGFGASPLAWADMWAWASLTGRRMTPWEVHCIRAVDRVWVEAASKES